MPTRDARSLGCYILPGGVPDPRIGLDQARAADELGLGTIWLSERWGTKDFPSLLGACSQVAPNVRLATGTTHLQSRNPVMLASTMATLQSISNGRLIIGVGKLTDSLWDAVGLPRSTNRLIADVAGMLRALLSGEDVTYDGPAGSFRGMRLMDVPEIEPVPLVIGAIGPKTLDLAGRHFDGLLVHPFLTPEAVGRQAEQVRAAAVDAGRDPSAIRIYPTVVTAADLPPAGVDEAVYARIVTYLQVDPLGSAMIEANGWDRAPLEALRNHPEILALEGRYADFSMSKADRARIGRETIPDEWVRSASAVGTLAEAAERLHEFLDAGADEIVIHGSTPETLGPVVGAFVDAAATR